MQTKSYFRKVSSQQYAIWRSLVLLITFLLSSFIGVSQTTVNILDDNFRVALIEISGINAGTDTNIIVDDISTVTFLYLFNRQISDLTGIEAFTALYWLDCANNQLTNLDVSKNTALTNLDCRNNQLSELDVSENTALIRLDCRNNQLSELDVSENTALIRLGCEGNQLISLNIKNGNNNSLPDFNANTNPNLTCIQIDDGFTPPSSWNKDARASYSNNCAVLPSTTVNIPDDNFRAALIEISGINAGTDTNIIVDDISTVISLILFDKQISDLTGIEAFTALYWLDCANNQLTNLDVSKNTVLTNLDCRNNKLSELDVSKNTTLISLSCYNNQLTNLDISKNTALATLYCSRNQLISLNIKNGNNNSFSSFFAINNPNLTCIQVDDTSNTPSAWQKDTMANYSTDCSATLTIMGVAINTTGHAITMQTSEPVTLTNVDNEDFIVTSTLNGVITDHQVTRIVSGSIVLTVTPAIPMEATVSVSYDSTQGNSMEVVADSEGNPMSSFTNITVMNVLSDDDFEITSFSVFPNPTRDILNITVIEKADYKILNIRGKTLKTGVLDIGNNEINLSPFVKGVYLLNIKTSRGSFTQKVARN